MKNVAILVDLRRGMDEPIGPLMAGLTRLKVVQRTLKKLIKTFGEGDGVSLTTYPQSNFSTSPEIVKPIDDLMRLRSFQQSVETMQAVTNVLAPDLSVGMSDALENLKLMRSGASGNPVEVVLVFTFGNVGVENAIQVIQGYITTAPQTLAPPAVFLYGVAISDPVALQNLSDIAYNVSGLARNVGTGDYLLGIYSYFDYLSRFYAYENGTEPRWARRYEDAFDMGNITTLVMPVFRKTGHLIGVAAMDVRDQPDIGAFTTITLRMKNPPRQITSLRDVLNLTDCKLTASSTPGNMSACSCEDRLPPVDCQPVPLEIEDIIMPMQSTPATFQDSKCCGACLDNANPGPISGSDALPSSPPAAPAIPSFQTGQSDMSQAPLNADDSGGLQAETPSQGDVVNPQARASRKVTIIAAASIAVLPVLAFFVAYTVCTKLSGADENRTDRANEKKKPSRQESILNHSAMVTTNSSVTVSSLSNSETVFVHAAVSGPVSGSGSGSGSAQRS